MSFYQSAKFLHVIQIDTTDLEEDVDVLKFWRVPLACQLVATQLRSCQKTILQR